MRLKEFTQHYTLRRFNNLFFLGLSHLPMPGRLFRPLLVKMGGVRFDDYKSVFLGVDISWDTVAPQKIHVGKGACITTGTIILTHYQNNFMYICPSYDRDTNIHANESVPSDVCFTSAATNDSFMLMRPKGDCPWRADAAA